MSPAESGYVSCACRDCFEVAIGERGALCHACKDAGCEPCTCHDPEGDRATGAGRCPHGECRAPGAYGAAEDERAEVLDLIDGRAYELDGVDVGMSRRWALENDLSPEELRLVAALEVGDVMNLGGGAGATMVLRRTA